MRITVLSSGNLDSLIAIVGEAPGEVEEKLGRPFVGTSGAELDSALISAGIQRGECYITNVIKFKPNHIDDLINFTGDRVLVSGEFKEQIAYLKDELTKFTGNIIIAVGTVAMYALTGIHGKILSRRGSVYTSTLVSGRKVIVVVHPSYILRNQWTQEGYIHHFFLILDMVRAKNESTFSQLRSPERRLRIMPTVSDIQAYVSNAISIGTVGFDIEISMKTKKLTHLGIAISPLDSMSIPLFHKGVNYYTLLEEAQIMRIIASLLENKNVVKVGQNIIFDCSFMLREYGIVTRGVLNDTLVAHRILLPDYPSGLDTLCSLYTNEQYYKSEGKEYMKLGDSDENFQRYNAKDAAVVLEIFPILYSRLLAQQNYEAYNRHMLIHSPLMYMQEMGMNVNTELLKDTNKEVTTKLSRLESQFAVATNGINPMSNKELMTYFYITKGYTQYINRKTKKWTVDRKSLIGLKKKGSKEAALLIDIRELSKLKSTYLDVKLRNNRFYYAFKPIKPTTGRLSSSSNIWNEGTNFQNLPSEFKQFIIADPGHILVELDYSQAENRIVAHIAPEPKLIKAFKCGEDIHRLTASSIFGIPPEQISDEEGSAPEIGDGRRSQRFWGKTANHSFNYDLSPNGLSDRTQIPLNQAKFIHSIYHQTYQFIKGGFHLWIRDQLKRNLTLINLKGRKRIFTMKWGDDLFRKAYAFIPQSTVADMVNNVIIYIWENRSSFKGLKLLGQVHDSVVLEISITEDIGHIFEMLQAIKKFMEIPLSFKEESFIIPVEIKIGTIWSKLARCPISELKDKIKELI